VQKLSANASNFFAALFLATPELREVGNPLSHSLFRQGKRKVFMNYLTTENTFTNYPDVVNVKQLQEMLSIGRNTAYELIGSRKLKSIRINNQIKIAKQSVVDFLNEGGTAA